MSDRAGVHVTVFRDGEAVCSLQVNRSPVTIGAGPQNDVVLDDPYVSGEHSLVYESEGKLFYVDHSTNGSYVAGKRIRKCELSSAEPVTVHPFQLRFSLATDDGTRRTLIRPAPAGPPPSGSDTPQPAPRHTPHPGPGPAETRPAAPVHRFHGAACLRVLRGPPRLEGEVLALPREGAVSIGRGYAADIRVEHPTVSRSHARVRRDEDGVYWLEDLQSANGTTVNGQRVGVVTLEPGDRIVLGGEVEAELVADPSRVPLPPGEGDVEDGENRPEESGEDEERSAEVFLELRARSPSPEESVVQILDLEGRLDAGNYGILAESVERALDRGRYHVVLNLERLDSIDHAGLGVLVQIDGEVERRGGRLRLVGVGEELGSALMESRLDGLFADRIFPDENQALRDLERQS